MGAFIDRTGQTFGDLTVVKFTRKNSRKQSFWLCKCSCGREKEVFSGNLNSGHTRSCGCKKGCSTHGESGQSLVSGRSPEYQAMASMIQRCTNPNSPAYKFYGGAGVKVSKEWDSLEKFNAFLQHVGRKPSPHHTIDRHPISNGNYEPGNVRWATTQEQTRNTVRNVWLTFGGETLCREDMAIKYGIHVATLKKRLSRGMSVEEALTKPINQKMRNRRAK